MRKLLSIALLAVVVLSSLVFVNNVRAATNFSGIISSDTTWTKANSPYSITGNVLVNSGVTLTIEAGTTVNLNDRYIQVDGCLVAKGSSTDKIYFNTVQTNPTVQIYFTKSSSGWDEQSGSGSIIENAVLSETTFNIKNASPKINNNYFEGYYGQSCTISIDGGQPIISNNTFVGKAPVLAFSCIRLDNQNKALISENLISGGFPEAIDVFNSSPTVERNLVLGSNIGILVMLSPPGSLDQPIIQKNTLYSNKIGISFFQSHITVGNENISTNIYQNNVYNNNYNVHVDNNGQGQTPYSVDLSNNWWGTTDTATIDEKIFDFTEDFNLARIIYNPILTAPNPEAPAVPENFATPSLQPTTQTTQNPTQPPYNPPTQSPAVTSSQPVTGISFDFGSIDVAIFAVLVVIAVLLAILIVVFLVKKR